MQKITINKKSKQKLKLLLSILGIEVIVIAIILYFIHPPEPYILQTYKTEKFLHKTFSVKQPNGKYIPMADVFWLKNKILSTDDILHILKKTNLGLTWTKTTDNSDYTRWRRSDNKAEATYRKKDGRLILYRKEFAEWKIKYGKKNKDLLIKIMQ